MSTAFYLHPISMTISPEVRLVARDGIQGERLWFPSAFWKKALKAIEGKKYVICSESRGMPDDLEDIEIGLGIRPDSRFVDKVELRLMNETNNQIDPSLHKSR
jgi:hypothetical protein